jgi:hypothetical protein
MVQVRATRHSWLVQSININKYTFLFLIWWKNRFENLTRLSIFGIIDIENIKFDISIIKYLITVTRTKKTKYDASRVKSTEIRTLFFIALTYRSRYLPIYMIFTFSKSTNVKNIKFDIFGIYNNQDWPIYWSFHSWTTPFFNFKKKIPWQI